MKTILKNMRKVKYILNDRIDLTKDKIYDVIDTKITKPGVINVLVKNDLDKEEWYVTISSFTGYRLFIDVTREYYRNEIIEEILL